MDEPILQVKNLKKYYYVQKNFFSTHKTQIRAVDGVSFALIKSRAFAIVGESGSGKTTLAKIILKLIEPTSGEVNFSSEITDLRKDVQMVFQNPYNSLDPLMNIRSIILEPLLIHKNAICADIKSRVTDLLSLVHIDPNERFRFPNEFSGGERQRISLARALATEPKVIILDEPVSSLDVRIQEQILKLLKELQEKFGLTYLFITHNLGVVKNFCDYCLVMYLGKIMENCTVSDLFTRPLHPYSESLFLACKKKISKLKIETQRFKKISSCIFNTRCPYAKDKCFDVEPALEEKVKGHFVYCHFPLLIKGE